MAYFTPTVLREILIDIKPVDFPTPKIIIETGTADGATTFFLPHFFDQVHTIERSHELFKRIASRLKVSGIHGHKGSSADILPQILQPHPTTFYLDAHWCRGYDHLAAGANQPPVLWKELEIISEREQQDIIIIDDVHAFSRGKNSPRYTPKYGDWSNVNPISILDKFDPSTIIKSEVYNDQFVIFRDGTKKETATELVTVSSLQV